MCEEARLELLMALRVQGVGKKDRLALATGQEEEVGAQGAQALVGEGLAVLASGPVEGFSLTEAGREELEKSLAAEGLRGNAQLEDAYERFLEINSSLLEVVSDWQVRRQGGAEIPNDHSDPEYDQGVLDRLIAVHDRAGACVRRMGRVASRFLRYRERLGECAGRIEEGEREAVAAPLAESYHTVWFELHQDLLLTLGLEREE